MTFNPYPFSSSKDLSEWSSRILNEQRVDQISNWRMIEYWMQVELYRAVESGDSGEWRHYGNFEQPYYTTIPRSGSRYNIKWIDLAFASPTLNEPEKIVWIELKDIGRSPHTLVYNARGLGQDLSALYTIDPIKTKEVWLNPPKHVLDKGRTDEWSELSKGFEKAQHLISQIVLVPLFLLDTGLEDQLRENWLMTFRNRITTLGEILQIDIQYEDTDKFRVFALVMKPLCEKQQRGASFNPPTGLPSNRYVRNREYINLPILQEREYDCEAE